MKLHSLLLAIFFLSFTINDTYGQFAFSVASSDGKNFSQDIASDDNGNTFIIGHFDGTIDLDPSSALFELTSINEQLKDIFVASYDSNGNFRFAFRIGEAQFDDEARGIEVDTEGNIYISGIFTGVMDFDPSGNVFELVSDYPTVENGFVASYSSNGNFRFAHSLGNGGTASLFGQLDIKIDETGNSYVSGLYWGTIDFDPSANVHELSTGINLSTFLASYDKEGNFRYVIDLGDSFYFGLNTPRLSTDKFGNSYLTGNFFGIVDFDPGVDTFQLTSTNSNNIFIASYDAMGIFRFAFKLEVELESLPLFTGIAIDDNGNLFLTGIFKGTVDIDPSNAVYELNNINDDLYLASYDASGGFRFAFTIGSEATVSDTMHIAIPTDIKVDQFGNSYITGAFGKTIDFDSGSSSFELDNEDSDIFIASYSSDGDFRFASNLGDNEDSFPRITVNSNQESCIVADINGSIALNNGVYEFIDDFSESIMVSCVASDGTIVTSNENLFQEKTWKIFPNPAEETVTIEMENDFPNGEIQLINISGQIVLRTILNSSSTNLNISDIPQGYYVLKIINSKEERTSPLIIR